MPHVAAVWSSMFTLRLLLPECTAIGGPDDCPACNPPLTMAEAPAGTRFRDRYGDVWIRGERHPSHDDVWVAIRERDGYRAEFAGQAEFDGALIRALRDWFQS